MSSHLSFEALLCAAESMSESAQRHIRSCAYCAHAVAQIKNDIYAMEHIPDSPMSAQVVSPAKTYTSRVIAVLRAAKLFVLENEGFSLFSAAATRGISPQALASEHVLVHPGKKGLCTIEVRGIHNSCEIWFNGRQLFSQQGTDTVMLTQCECGNYEIHIDTQCEYVEIRDKE